MAAYGDIGRKAARAIAAVIKSNQPGTVKLSGVQVVAQFDATQLSDEYVAVVCRECVGESFGDVFTGNWRCDVEVAYTCRREDRSADDFETAASELFDILCLDDVSTQCNNVGIEAFHAFGGAEGAGERWPGGEGYPRVGMTVEDGAYVRTFIGQLYCCPSSAEGN